MGIHEEKPIDCGSGLGADAGVEDFGVEVAEDGKNIIEQPDAILCLDLEDGGEVIVFVGEVNPLRDVEVRRFLLRDRRLPALR